MEGAPPPSLGRGVADQRGQEVTLAVRSSQSESSASRPLQSRLAWASAPPGTAGSPERLRRPRPTAHSEPGAQAWPSPCPAAAHLHSAFCSELGPLLHPKRNGESSESSLPAPGATPSLSPALFPALVSGFLPLSCVSPSPLGSFPLVILLLLSDKGRPSLSQAS